MQPEEINLGIDPKPISETEARQMELLLNFMKKPRGLSFAKIRQMMKHHYGNENQLSDEKKFHRDLEELKELGFFVRYYKSSLENPQNLGNVYRLEGSKISTDVQFDQNELKLLSLILSEEIEMKNSSYDLVFSISQKIFARNLSLFPEMQAKEFQKDTKEDIEKSKEKFLKLVQAIKDKTPLKIHYRKSEVFEMEIREIEPVEVVRKGIDDFYMIAFDRVKKDFRKFIIPKIEKISEIQGIFIHSRKPSKEEKSFHPLSFQIHEKETIRLRFNKEDIWRIKNFLADFPYSQKENTIELTTTNLSSLCDFYYRTAETKLDTDSTKLISLFEDYCAEIQKNYELSGI